MLMLMKEKLMATTGSSSSAQNEPQPPPAKKRNTLDRAVGNRLTTDLHSISVDPDDLRKRSQVSIGDYGKLGSKSARVGGSESAGNLQSSIMKRRSASVSGDERNVDGVEGAEIDNDEVGNDFDNVEASEVGNDEIGDDFDDVDVAEVGNDGVGDDFERVQAAGPGNDSEEEKRQHVRDARRNRVAQMQQKMRESEAQRRRQWRAFEHEIPTSVAVGAGIALIAIVYTYCYYRL
jgi:hypothetical protein